MDYTIQTANRMTVSRAVGEVNATIGEMRREPGGGPPAREKKRLYRYGLRRGWKWSTESRGFVLRGDEPR